MRFHHPIRSLVAARRRGRAGPAACAFAPLEGRRDDRGSRGADARNRRRQREGHRPRQGLPGSAQRRSEAQFHPGRQPRRSADRRRPRTRDRLAAAAHHAEPQREDPARVAPGYLDASLTVKILEIPTGQITRAMGDVHPSGNPHYWLDPGNGRLIAQAIQQKLGELDAADKAYFAQRYADFDKRLAAGEKRWDAMMAPYKGTKVVTYHRSWPNFMERFGLDVMGYVEPKPGIPPSPSHTIELIAAMKAQGVKLIVMESYFDAKTPEKIALEVGGKVVTLAPSVGGEKAATDYIQLFEYNVATMAAALKQVDREVGGSWTGRFSSF